MNWLVDADITEPLIVSQVQASGGIESEIVIRGQRYRLHTYFSSGSFSIDGPGGNVEMLLVGGGGSGGSVPLSGSLGSFGSYASSGGGGGGGVLEAVVPLNVGTSVSFPVVVGSGGVNSDGGDTYVGVPGVGGDFPLAKGGGKGGDATTSSPYVTNGQSGGSGGGGAAVDSSTLGDHESDGGDRFFGQGNFGADAVASSLIGASTSIAGGGGGAGSAGQDGSNAPPNGGNGVISSITGKPVFYGGGGAGGYQEIFPLFVGATPAVGGVGGGGSNIPFNRNGVNGLGGGGVGGLNGQTSFGLLKTKATPGNGGSGVVIIRYPIEG